MIAPEFEAYQATVAAADAALVIVVLVLVVGAYLVGHRDGYAAGRDDHA